MLFALSTYFFLVPAVDLTGVGLLGVAGVLVAMVMTFSKNVALCGHGVSHDWYETHFTPVFGLRIWENALYCKKT